VSTKIAVRRGLAAGWRPFASIAARTARVIILIYHAVTNDEASDAAQLTVSRRRFADQMQWLRELGHPVVSLGSAVRDLRAGTLRAPVVVLTFDDGYRSFYDGALPVLTEYGYPGPRMNPNAPRSPWSTDKAFYVGYALTLRPQSPSRGPRIAS
jgi:hypothetical protein